MEYALSPDARLSPSNYICVGFIFRGRPFHIVNRITGDVLPVDVGNSSDYSYPLYARKAPYSQQLRYRMANKKLMRIPVVVPRV